MLTRHDFPVLWQRLRPSLKRAFSTNALTAIAFSALAAGAFLALSENPSSQASSGAAAAAASAATTKTAAVSVLACDRQTWPYLDLRCNEAASEQARKTRQVRVITGGGKTVTMVTPLPVAEPPRHPEPPRAVAMAPMQIGPPVIPVKLQEPPQAKEEAQQSAAGKNLTTRSSARRGDGPLVIVPDRYGPETVATIGSADEPGPWVYRVPPAIW
jgi:hypothetical protein